MSLVDKHGPMGYKLISDESNIPVDYVVQIILEANLVRPGQIKLKYVDRSEEWKDSVVDYYREHTRYQTAEFFRCSAEVVARALKERNVLRRSQAQELALTKIQQYGSIEAYNAHMIEQCRKTSFERYGVDNFAKSPEFSRQSKQTCLQRYGVENPMMSDEVKERLSDKCLEKFGVPWSCMREEARMGGRGSNSKPNLQFYTELQEVITNTPIQREFVLDKFSYDFKVGDTLIEINPSSTHNSTWGLFGTKPHDKDYHRNKTAVAERNGYRCIHVWDWDNFSAIIQLLTDRPSVYARKCEVREIDVPTAKEFISRNHIQGYARDTIRFGLYYKGELISVMTFGSPRYNKKYQYELVRYCSSWNVTGGVEKLFRYFVRKYNPESIISYCDRSKFTGDSYTRLGFDSMGECISKHWVSMKTGRHITDNLLRQRGFDQLLGQEYGKYGKGASNEKLMLKHGFVEVYDAGQATYVWSS